jgi:Family of unknown function (DUF6263)
MRSYAIVRVSLAAVLAVVFVTAVQAQDLRWKFKPDETLNYVLERGVEGKIVLSGAEIAFTMGMTFDTSWKVASVADDGMASVELAVDRIQVSMNSPLFGNMVYDSKGGEEPKSPVWQQMKPVMNGMLAGPFKVKISPLGEVSDVALPEKLAKSLADQEIGENRRQGFGIGGNPFGEKGIKELIAKSVLILPQAKDGEWTQTFENALPGLGKQTAETKFTAAGTEKKDGRELAKITSLTELVFEPEENPRAELEIMSQEAAGTYYFDREAGHLVSAEGVQQVGMEVTGRQEVTQEIKETTKMRLGKSPDKPAAADKESKDAKAK